jgi:hypothetical protein
MPATPNLLEPSEGECMLAELQLSNSGNVEDLTALALSCVAFAAADRNG